MASTVRVPRRADARTAKPALTLAPMSRRIAGAAIDMVVLVAAAGVVSSLLEGVTAGITRERVDAQSGERTVD